MDKWTVLIWIFKVLFYISTVSVIGGIFFRFAFSLHIQMHKFLISYITAQSMTGFLSILFLYFLQIGSFSDSGFSGIFNPLYFKIFGSTWAAKFYILIGLSFLAIFIYYFLAILPAQKKPAAAEAAVSSLFCLLIFISFAQIGHLANYAAAAQAVLILHVMLVSIWMGSLFPLFKLCRQSNTLNLQKLMQKFGKIAAGLVMLLIACGAAVAMLLLKQVSAITDTAYGQSFALKLFLVCSILAVAAANKLYLTPRLLLPGFPQKLSRFILFEMLLGFLILATTAYFTTAVGI